jgi:hypothetical protein
LIHETLLAAVQPHPDPTTLTLPLPPGGPKDLLVAESVSGGLIVKLAVAELTVLQPLYTTTL